jgi:hypothetical protein
LTPHAIYLLYIVHYRAEKKTPDARATTLNNNIRRDGLAELAYSTSHIFNIYLEFDRIYI